MVSSSVDQVTNKRRKNVHFKNRQLDQRKAHHEVCLLDKSIEIDENDLEALAVNDLWAGLVVLLLRDPHLLEGGERCQDRTSDPDGVFTLRRSNDLDLH